MLRMLKGSCPDLSTPAEDVSTNLAIVSGALFMRVVVATKSVASGLPPAHLRQNIKCVTLCIQESEHSR